MISVSSSAANAAMAACSSVCMLVDHKRGAHLSCLCPIHQTSQRLSSILPTGDAALDGAEDIGKRGGITDMVCLLQH